MKEDGFSTFETILFICIIGIILSTTTLSINTYKKNFQKYEYKRFIDDLNLAKNASKLEKIKYYIILDNKKQEYMVYSQYNLKIKIIKKRKFNSGVKLLWNNFTNEIVYNHGVLGKGGSVTLEVNGENKVLSLTPVVTKINEKD